MEIEKNHQCEDVTDFIGLLRWWVEKTDENQVGDPAAQGNTSWVRVAVNAIPCHLNADTNRAGVLAFLRAVEVDPVMTVVVNNRGAVNKVAVGHEQLTFLGFYFYSDSPLTG